MEAIEPTQNRKKLLGIGAGIAVVAAVGGVFIGQSFQGQPPAAAEAEHGEEKGEAPAREGFVAMSPERLAAAGLVTETAAPGAVSAEIIAQATVTAPPEGQAALTARADGAVIRITKRLGDPVRAGEIVALLESRDAGTISAERGAAAARAQAARLAYARERRLFQARVTARQDLEAAEATLATAEAELRRTQSAAQAARVTGNGRQIAVTSLINGRITEVNTQLGAYVLAGAQLFRVADPRSVQIEASVPSDEAQRIRPGDPATIELPGGSTVDAVVRSATPTLNAESRTATIVLVPTGTPAGLTQGQGVRARITPRGTATSGRIVLPEEAVQSVEGRNVVFVRTRDGFQATPVGIGARVGGRVEILEGLRPGAVVVTVGAFRLKSELGASEAEH